MDLLYPNTTYVHASHFTDEEWALVRDSGGNVSFAPQIEVQMGHGWAPAVKALEYGIPIGLSSDVATTASADQFTQMHSIFGTERGRKHQEAWDADLDGLQASPGLITSRQVLRWATLGGAKVAGIAHRTGSHHAGQEGRPRDHRHEGRQHGAGHRPRRGRRLRRRRLQRQDGPRRRRDPQGRLQAQGRPDAPRDGVLASKDYLLSKFGEPEPGWLPATPPPSRQPPLDGRGCPQPAAVDAVRGLGAAQRAAARVTRLKM